MPRWWQVKPPKNHRRGCRLSPIVWTVRAAVFLCRVQLEFHMTIDRDVAWEMAKSLRVSEEGYSLSHRRWPERAVFDTLNCWEFFERFDHEDMRSRADP